MPIGKGQNLSPYMLCRSWGTCWFILSFSAARCRLWNQERGSRAGKQHQWLAKDVKNSSSGEYQSAQAVRAKYHGLGIFHSMHSFPTVLGVWNPKAKVRAGSVPLPRLAGGCPLCPHMLFLFVCTSLVSPHLLIRTQC